MGRVQNEEKNTTSALFMHFNNTSGPESSVS